MTRKRKTYAPVSVFRSHSKTDDQTLVQLAYYFCNGISVKAVAETLNLSRKTVRAHYLDLRARLSKPKFSRWHSVYTVLVSVSDPEQERKIKGGMIEALSVCYFSGCYGNFASGQRKRRICRSCPLPRAFTTSQNTADAIDIIDQTSAFYRRLGIREDAAPNKLDMFFARFIHASVIACVRENSKRLPDGLLDPADNDFQAVGTLLTMLMDDLAGDRILADTRQFHSLSSVGLS